MASGGSWAGRVLFTRAVYFPRVNGVPPPLRPFRQDLGSHGVDTRLVAPHYDCPPAAPEEQGVLRVPAARVPRDPEDRRMRWRALTRALDALPASEFDLVHIHTPFIAHYAGVRFARRSEEHTSELQSPCNLVCRLLLEKKKQTKC